MVVYLGLHLSLDLYCTCMKSNHYYKAVLWVTVSQWTMTILRWWPIGWMLKQKSTAHNAVITTKLIIFYQKRRKGYAL